MPVAYVDIPAGVNDGAKKKIFRELYEEIHQAWPIPDTRVLIREWPNEAVSQDGRIEDVPMRPFRRDPAGQPGHGSAVHNGDYTRGCTQASQTARCVGPTHGRTGTAQATAPLVNPGKGAAPALLVAGCRVQTSGGPA